MEDDKYLKGPENWLIRMYFYLERGLDVLNLFRNYLLALFAVYVGLHLTNLLWLGLFASVSLIGLLLAGYLSVHHISKVTEFLSIRFGTHYGRETYSHTEQQTALLTEIRDLVRSKI